MDSIQKHPGALESNVSDQLESSVKQALPQTTGKDTLTTLPVELQTISFKSLNVLDKLNLKFVNKYFYALIPQYSHADYLQVEQYTGAKGRFYACCICCRFRPRAKFSDNARIQTKGVSHLSVRSFARPQAMYCARYKSKSSNPSENAEADSDSTRSQVPVKRRTAFASNAV